jgi:predicted nucleic acid-binding protein
VALSAHRLYLLDTGVIKRLGRPRVREVVEPLARRGQAACCTICDLEVGYSARNADEWDQLVGALESFVPVAATETPSAGEPSAESVRWRWRA